MNEDKDIVMPNFMVDTSLKDCVNILSDTRAGKLFKLLFEYAENQDIDQSQLDSAVRLAFNAFKPGVDKGRKKYISVIKRNRENGKKGGRPKKPKTTQNNPKNPVGNLETQNNPKNPVGNLETQNNPKKQIKINKSKVISKDITLRKVSSAGLPEGQPAPKPEFSEIRKFYKDYTGFDDAYLCDEFVQKMDKNDVDWDEWESKLLAYAIKTGKLNE